VTVEEYPFSDLLLKEGFRQGERHVEEGGMVEEMEFLEPSRVRVLNDVHDGLDPAGRDLSGVSKAEAFNVDEDDEPIELRVDGLRGLVHGHEEGGEGLVQAVVGGVPVLDLSEKDLSAGSVFGFED